MDRGSAGAGGASITRAIPILARGVLAASQVGVWRHDPKRGVICCDAVLSEMFGFDPDEARDGLSGDRFREAVHPDDRAMLMRRVDHLNKVGGLTAVEYRVVPRPGEFRWILVRGRYEPIRPGQGIMAGRGIVVDITECKLDGDVEGQAVFLQSELSRQGTPLEEDADHPIARLCDAALAMQTALRDMRAHDDKHEPLERCNQLTLSLIADLLSRRAMPNGWN